MTNEDPLQAPVTGATVQKNPALEELEQLSLLSTESLPFHGIVMGDLASPASLPAQAHFNPEDLEMLLQQHQQLEDMQQHQQLEDMQQHQQLEDMQQHQHQLEDMRQYQQQLEDVQQQQGATPSHYSMDASDMSGDEGGAAFTGKKPASDRRAMHNATERQRREILNVRFHDLSQCIPALVDVKKPSKSQIVTKSLDYVRVCLFIVTNCSYFQWFYAVDFIIQVHASAVA
jgi:hypothetical protein